jgi:hypothetical protein
MDAAGEQLEPTAALAKIDALEARGSLYPEIAAELRSRAREQGGLASADLNYGITRTTLYSLAVLAAEQPDRVRAADADAQRAVRRVREGYRPSLYGVLGSALGAQPSALSTAGRATSRPRERRASRRVAARSPGRSDPDEPEPPPRRRTSSITVARCGGCGETFEPTRSDAKTCSSACRQRVHRRRRAGLSAEELAKSDTQPRSISVRAMDALLREWEAMGVVRRVAGDAWALTDDWARRLEGWGRIP